MQPEIHAYSLVGTTGLSTSISVTALACKRTENRNNVQVPGRARSKVLSQSSQSVTCSGSYADGNRRRGVGGIH